MGDKEERKQIEIDHVVKVFKSGNTTVRALGGIDLKIDEGEFLVLFGPSGCGKSTLLNTLIGIEKPTRGEVWINGTNLYSLKEDDRSEYRASKFGVVYQSQNWIKSLNSRENVALPLVARGIKFKDAVKKAEKFMAELKIAELLRQTPTQLSGGQQQKLGIARALISSPKIIFADEPTGNLDSKSSDMVIDFLTKINRDLKRTIILITHNPEYWDIGHRKIEMEDGKVIRDERKNG